MQPMKTHQVNESRPLRPMPSAMSYAATVDSRIVEHEITDFMVRRACEEMDAVQQYPFCGRKPKKRRG